MGAAMVVANLLLTRCCGGVDGWESGKIKHLIAAEALTGTKIGSQEMN